MTSWRLAKNTERMARAIAERMPHLEFAIWDLSEFMPAFHDVRRNMIFIECNKIALKEVMRTLASDPKLGNYLFYLGERKPRTVNEEWASAKSVEEIRDVVVIIARKDFTETTQMEGNARVPSVERRVVDLLAYSLRGWLPITVDEAIDAFLWSVKQGQLKTNTSLQRYATRRYLGWFLDLVLFKLEEKGEINRTQVDPRYIEAGQRYLNAIKRVENL